MCIGVWCYIQQEHQGAWPYFFLLSFYHSQQCAVPGTGLQKLKRPGWFNPSMMWSPSDWFSYNVKSHPMSALQVDYTKLQKSSCLHGSMVWNGSSDKCHCLGVMLWFWRYVVVFFFQLIFMNTCLEEFIQQRGAGRIY